MSSHINFVFGGVEEKISGSYSSEIQKDVEDTYNYHQDETLSFTCKADPADPYGGVGVWQWVV